MKGIELANRLREVFLNGKWIANTNYKEQISSLDWKQATQKIGSLNTIAALTFHINYYTKGILSVFEGGTLDIKDQYSFDMPPITSNADWEKLVEELLFNAERFVDTVSKMSDERLNSLFVEEKYGTYHRNIEGVLEHSYYHLGQISLIKKLLLEK
ncbi:MAG: DinB family protein [Flavobacteriaceae bacterium]